MQDRWAESALVKVIRAKMVTSVILLQVDIGIIRFIGKNCPIGIPMMAVKRFKTGMNLQPNLVNAFHKETYKKKVQDLQKYSD